MPKPGSEDGYLFKKQTLVLGEACGYADVFKRAAFAWENKAPGRNLDLALKQLLNYSSVLSKPPILARRYEFKKSPVPEPLDNIECRDALLTFVAYPESEAAQAGQMPAVRTLRFLKSPPASAPPAFANSSSNSGSDLRRNDAGSAPKLGIQLTQLAKPPGLKPAS